jgi:CheY-like chemotaxis protein
MQILVADDDRNIVETQAMILRRRDFSVITCTEGKDVMPLVEQHHPDVILLDLIMPGMNGFDIALELKENPDLRPTLLIAITGITDDGAKEMTARAGFDYHLIKPIHPAKLLAILATAFPNFDTSENAAGHFRP